MIPKIIKENIKIETTRARGFLLTSRSFVLPWGKGPYQIPSNEKRARLVALVPNPEENRTLPASTIASLLCSILWFTAKFMNMITDRTSTPSNHHQRHHWLHVSSLFLLVVINPFPSRPGRDTRPSRRTWVTPMPLWVVLSIPFCFCMHGVVYYKGLRLWWRCRRCSSVLRKLDHTA